MSDSKQSSWTLPIVAGTALVTGYLFGIWATGRHFVRKPVVTIVVRGTNKPGVVMHYTEIMKQVFEQLQTAAEDPEDSEVYTVNVSDIKAFRKMVKNLTHRARQELPQTLLIFEWIEHADT